MQPRSPKIWTPNKAVTSLAIQYPFYDDLSGEESAQNSVQ